MDEKTPTINVMEIEQLKKILDKFGKNVRFEHDLKKKIGLILEVNRRFFIRQII